jgi:hypothetical protein
VYEKRVLRRISRPKRDEVTGSWRKLHNEELPQLVIFSGGKARRKETTGKTKT